MKVSNLPLVCFSFTVRYLFDPLMYTSQSTIFIPSHWPGMSAAFPGPEGRTPSPSGCAITPQGVPAVEGEEKSGWPTQTYKVWGWRYLFTLHHGSVFFGGCFYLHLSIQVCYNYYLYHLLSWNCYTYYAYFISVVFNSSKNYWLIREMVSLC